VATSHVHDRKLLDTLEQLEPISLSVEVWRVAWKSRSVLEGGPGGRWNPPNSFLALYTSLDADGALAEIYHHLSQAPVRSSADKLLYGLKVRTRQTLPLNDAKVLDSLGLTEGALALADISRSQEIGAAAHLLGCDSVLVPSARWSCDNLVLFSENMPPDDIEVGAAYPVNWPAWREKNAPALEAIQAHQRSLRLKG